MKQPDAVDVGGEVGPSPAENDGKERKRGRQRRSGKPRSHGVGAVVVDLACDFWDLVQHCADVGARKGQLKNGHESGIVPRWT